mgnify:CR=1 FL=1
MKVVREMYARGFEFLPIDIYESGANRFKIKDGKLLPSLSTISGLGEKAAEAVVDAVKVRSFRKTISATVQRSARQSWICYPT